jgi:hypothetical protein
MTEPPPLEQARSSLEFWSRRRAALPVHRRRARREADEMIRRCRQRVAAAEQRLYGTGFTGFVRRLLAGDYRSSSGLRVGLVAFAWALVPRRLKVFAAAVLLTWMLTGIVVLLALASLLS